MTNAIRVVSYEPRYRADFDRLNRAWVTEHFAVEPGDEAELGDPGGHFVATGGQILFLLAGETVIGTAALARHGDAWELAKMTVDAAHRGRGYGDRLLTEALAYAKNAGASHIELVSNTKLDAAIRLYRRHSFTEVPLEPGETYARVNIRMRRDL